MACIDEIYDDLLQLADFEEVGSVQRAREFITVANRWLILQPEEQQDQYSRIKFNTARIEALLVRARQYVRANDQSTAARSSVRFHSVENFR